METRPTGSGIHHETILRDGKIVEKTLTIDMNAHPFEAGETIWSYAQRMLHQNRCGGTIADVSVRVGRADVTPFGNRFVEAIPAETILKIVFNKAIQDWT